MSSFVQFVYADVSTVIAKQLNSRAFHLQVQVWAKSLLLAAHALQSTPPGVQPSCKINVYYPCCPLGQNPQPNVTFVAPLPDTSDQ